MIDPTLLITSIAIVAGFVFIPGPATVLTIARASSSGIIATSAVLFNVIKYAGAAYLIYLCLASLSTILFALTARGLGSYLRRTPAVLRWQSKLVGGIYIARGARLALQER